MSYVDEEYGELVKKEEDARERLQEIKEKAEELGIDLPDEAGERGSEIPSKCAIEGCHREPSYSLEGFNTRIDSFEEIYICTPCRNAINRFHSMDASGRVLTEIETGQGDSE